MIILIPVIQEYLLQ